MLSEDDFDESYFEGRAGKYKHNAGYSSYLQQRVHIRALTDKIISHNILDRNRRILDIGCAYGFMVEKLREEGYDAWGADHSLYALRKAPESIRNYVFKMDAFDIPKMEYHTLITSRVLICFSEEEMKRLILHFNEHYEKQIHVIEQQPNDQFYLAKDLNWWITLPWAEGTVLIDRNNINNPLWL